MSAPVPTPIPTLSPTVEGVPIAVRILVLDDDEVDRLALRRAIERSGLGPFAVEEAERAGDAFERIGRGDLDCAFFDFRLPDRDGVALLREVRAAGVRTPVVLLTGYGDEQTVVDAMKAGATDYVNKGTITPERIAQVLRAALRLGTAERQAASARAAQERYAAQLGGLTEAAVAVSEAESGEAVARTAAQHAARITGAAAAAVAIPEALARELGMASASCDWRDAAGEPAEPPADPVRIPLAGRDGNAPLGELTLAPWPEADRDMAVTIQLARLVAGALENLRLFRAAQAAARARDDVLAVVSHDLRNPLHTIALSASFLADTFADTLPEAALQQTGIIRRAIERANTLIQDLLDVSRIEAGGLSVETEPVAAEQLLGEAMEALAPTAEAAHVTLFTETDDALPAVRADRQRILQVFTNLVSNAVRFTPAGGTVTLRAHRDPARGGTMVRFGVRDTGSGIAPEDVPHLFDRFWQARGKARAGAGLGLAIARGIVLAHGGTIDVTSRVGEGTEFRFTLPVA